MQTFSQKQSQPQKTKYSTVTRPNPTTPRPASSQQPLAHLQHSIGDQAVQRMPPQIEEPGIGLTAAASLRFQHYFSRLPIHPPISGVIQAKLAINQPGDEYEREADRVSEQVMRMPESQLQRKCACGGNPGAGGECAKCREKRLQRKAPAPQPASQAGMLCLEQISFRLAPQPDTNYWRTN